MQRPQSFFGDDKKNKLDFDMWERQVLSAATTHSGTAIKQAMIHFAQVSTMILQFPPCLLILIQKELEEDLIWAVSTALGLVKHFLEILVNRVSDRVGNSWNSRL